MSRKLIGPEWNQGHPFAKNKWSKMNRWRWKDKLSLRVSIIKIVFLLIYILLPRSSAQPEYKFDCEKALLDKYCRYNGTCHDSLRGSGNTADQVMDCLQVYFNCDCKSGGLRTTTIPPTTIIPINGTSVNQTSEKCKDWCKKNCKSMPTKKKRDPKNRICLEKLEACTCTAQAKENNWVTIVIAVVCVVVVIVIGVVIWLYMRRRRKKVKQVQPTFQFNAPEAKPAPPPPPPPEELPILQESNQSLLGLPKPRPSKKNLSDDVASVDKKLIRGPSPRVVGAGASTNALGKSPQGRKKAPNPNTDTTDDSDAHSDGKKNKKPRRPESKGAGNEFAHKKKSPKS